MNNPAQLLEDSLLKIWNERDEAIRLQEIAGVYAADMAFYESNDGEAIVGHQDINNLINKLQVQWPLDFKFELTEPGRLNHDIQQISWRLGVPGQPAVTTGMDIALIADNKIKGLYLLMDAPVN